MKIDATQSAALAAASQAQAQQATKKPQKEAPPPPEVAGTDEIRAASSEPSAPQRQVSITFDESNRAIYQFFNQETGELVQQYPSEEVLRVARNIADLLDDEDASRGKNLNIDT